MKPQNILEAFRDTWKTVIFMKRTSRGGMAKVGVTRWSRDLINTMLQRIRVPSSRGESVPY